MEHPVLLDNTVLTNFAWAQAANLPLEFWRSRACTTQAVIEEYRVGISKVKLPIGVWSHLPVLELSSDERKWMHNQLPASLGLGEQTCLAAALYRQGVFASDDFRARKIAQFWHLPVVGSVGILIECERVNLITLDAAQSLLDQMIAAGYYAPILNLREFLSK